MATTSPNRAARQHPENAPLRRWASIPEAAAYIRVTTRTIRAMEADKRITIYRLSPRVVRVDLNELDSAMTPYGAGVSDAREPLVVPQGLRQGQKK